MGQRDNGPHDLRVLSMRAHPADEGAVNLQRVDRQTVEVTQRRIACAKVIDAQLDAQGLQLHKHGNGRI